LTAERAWEAPSERPDLPLGGQGGK